MKFIKASLMGHSVTILPHSDQNLEDEILKNEDGTVSLQFKYNNEKSIEFHKSPVRIHLILYLKDPERKKLPFDRLIYHSIDFVPNPVLNTDEWMRYEFPKETLDLINKYKEVILYTGKTNEKRKYRYKHWYNYYTWNLK